MVHVLSSKNKQQLGQEIPSMTIKPAYFPEVCLGSLVVNKKNVFRIPRAIGNTTTIILFFFPLLFQFCNPSETELIISLTERFWLS